jgi:hypothetical protein
MTDIIAGFVDGVLNRNTFDLNVKQIDPKNESTYKRTERIKMDNLPEKVNKMPAEDATQALKTGLVGKEVVCEIQSAESDGTLVCEVFYKK